MHGVGSRNKLTPSHARHYAGHTLLDAIGRAVCAAGCLPRKEVHEAYEMATRVHARFGAAPGATSSSSVVGGRVVDLCCGFGLLAQVMLLVDDTLTDALAVDVKPAPNHTKVHDALGAAFPQLRGRVRFVRARLDDVAIEPGDLVVSAHACGALTDDVVARAVDAGARVAVLPCCHTHRWRPELAGVDDPALAMDLERVERLRALGYDVTLAHIPVDVSPKNRVILGAPRG